MNLKPLIFACAGAGLLGSPVLFASSSNASTSPARVAKVVKVAAMDKLPVVLEAVLPNYPKELREVGMQGIVMVDMLIDSRGRVVATELVGTSDPALGQLAMEAAKYWTFVPASAKGKSITTRVRVPFEFVIPELVSMRSR